MKVTLRESPLNVSIIVFHVEGLHGASIKVLGVLGLEEFADFGGSGILYNLLGSVILEGKVQINDLDLRLEGGYTDITQRLVQ